MKFRHTFRVRASAQAVADFHSRAAVLRQITPPPAIIRLHSAPARLGEGDEMDFTLWLGPVPVRWVARFEAVGPDGFTDRQVRGPFGEWTHRHTFLNVDGHTTEVVDEIQATLRAHLYHGLVGLGMWLSLPLLFAYRGWRTRHLLERA